MIDKFHAFNEKVRQVIEGFAFLLIVLLTICTMTSVIFRYVFQSPIIWMYEVIVLMFAWMVFSGVYIAFTRFEHIRLTFLLNSVKGNVRTGLEVGIEIINTILLLIVVFNGFKLVQNTMAQVYNTIPVPIGFFYLAFPFLAIPMILNQIDGLLQRLSGRPDDDTLSSGAEI